MNPVGCFRDCCWVAQTWHESSPYSYNWNLIAGNAQHPSELQPHECYLRLGQQYWQHRDVHYVFSLKRKACVKALILMVQDEQDHCSVWTAETSRRFSASFMILICCFLTQILPFKMGNIRQVERRRGKKQDLFKSSRVCWRQGMNFLWSVARKIRRSSLETGALKLLSAAFFFPFFRFSLFNKDCLFRCTDAMNHICSTVLEYV